jgi:hypothetical protein
MPTQPPLVLPDNFSEWEHLQDTLRLAVNQQVQLEFSDVEVDNDLKAPRSSLKLACLIKDTDTSTMTLIRLVLYYVVIKGYGIPEIYSIPFESVMNLKYKPQIHLHFEQSYRDVLEGDYPVAGEIKVRIVNETTATLTNADALKYAIKIKALFGSGNGFTWAKGKDMFTYTDTSKGYKMQLLVQSETEGRRIVEKILEIQAHTPDWQYAQYKKNLEPTQAYPTSPPNTTIMSKSVKAFHKRRVCTVRFQVAFLHVQGLPKPVVLYDKTQHYKKALLHD